MEDCEMSSRLEVSRHREGNGTLPREKCWKTEASPTEDGTQLREYKAVHEEHFIISCFREDVEEGQAEMKVWKNEAEEEESESGKREVEREEEKLVIKRRCVNRVSSDVFDEFCPSDESESVGDPCGFSLRVLVVLSCVPVVFLLRWWVCLVKMSSLIPTASFLNRSPFLSLVSVKRSVLKVKDARVWKRRQKNTTSIQKQNSGIRMWT